MFKEYTIKKGDNLTKLSKQFGVDMMDLIKANNIADPDLIYIGDKLMIPVKSSPTPTQEKVKSYLSKPSLMDTVNVKDFGGEAESIAPETLLMGLGVPSAMVGGLTKLATMAPKAAKIGRVASPKGWSNVVPVGSNAAMNTGMAQAIKAGGNRVGKIPAWLESGGPEVFKLPQKRMYEQLGRDYLKKEPKFTIGGKQNPEADALQELIERMRMGDI
jgi:hypothetical protein